LLFVLNLIAVAKKSMQKQQLIVLGFFAHVIGSGLEQEVFLETC